MFQKFYRSLLSHKILTGILIVILCISGYYSYKSIWSQTTGEIRYVVASAEKGLIISSVSGSGQISASSQVDINPKVSGDIISIPIKTGQEVKSGQIIAQLNPRDAQKTVRDAQINLDSAKLSLEKLQQPVNGLSLLQANNSLDQARDNLDKLKLSQNIEYEKALETKQNAESDLAKSYDDGFNTVSNSFLNLPTIMTGLQEILYGNNLNSTQNNLDYYTDTIKYYENIDVTHVSKATQYKKEVDSSYQDASDIYDQNYEDYKSVTRLSDTESIEEIINQTYDTSVSIAETVKDTINLLQYYKDTLTEKNLNPNSSVEAYLSDLSTYTSQINTIIQNLLSIKTTIDNSENTISDSERNIEQMDLENPLDLASAEQSIKEKEASLEELMLGTDTLDLKAQELSIKQRENTLADAYENLSDYTVRAPFDGVIASVDAKIGDSISSGASIATLITKQKIAEISLNEVDAAKVDLGQKSTLTFDAVPDLTLTGEVIEIDTIGTVDQGVVSYNVKIGLDTEGEEIKPGMSVNASIIIQAKQDIIIVSNNAIKTQGDEQYVEAPVQNIPDDELGLSSGVILTASPKRQTIETGLSNDSYTEIISGLNEGDQIITKTISSASSTSTTSSSSQQGTSSAGLFGLTGGGGPPR